MSGALLAAVATAGMADDLLAEVVRVPAIVGPAFSGVTTTVAKEVTIPRNVLVISPSATSPSLTDLQDNGLVWRTAPSDVLQAKAMVLAVQDFVEPEVRATYMIAAGSPIRVAVVHKGDTYGAGLGNALFKTLKFNGLGAAANGGNYKQFDYGDPDKLTPEQLTAGLTPTQRVAGLAVEDRAALLATLPVELLRLFPEELLARLPEEVRATIERRVRKPGRPNRTRTQRSRGSKR